jgi:quercetin dioxygenase-like cupin family protein
VASTPAHRSPDGLGAVQLLLQAPQKAYLGRMVFQPGARAPEHSHDVSEELVYILSGQGEMTLGDRTVPLEAGTAVRIPAGVAHSFVIGGEEPMEVVQFYNPGGPEQRFEAWETDNQEARP